MFSAVIFDMDGLLVDSESRSKEAWMECCHKAGFELPLEIYLQVIGRTRPDSRKIFEDYFGPTFPYDEVWKAYRIILAENLKERGYERKQGAQELLQELSVRGVPCAVASSTYREQVKERLTEIQLIQFFSVYCGGDEVERGKPEPDIFLLAAERLGVSPSTCLVFEDSSFGAHAAHAAGMSPVIVPDLKQPDGETKALLLELLPSLSEAKPLLDGWFPLENPA